MNGEQTSLDDFIWILHISGPQTFPGTNSNFFHDVAKSAR